MLVDNNEDLRTACAAFPADAPYAIDVEFVRRSTYYPIVALVQLAAPGVEPILADTITLTDTEPICTLLSRKSAVKVVHAGSQDLEALDLSMDTLPDPLFDTQIAAAFCGMGFQISFADIVEKCLGKRISKRQQQSNWVRRPLRPAQLRYAEQDVGYLLEVYAVLIKKLTANGRLEWALTESQAMLDNYRDDPNQGRGKPERIRGAGCLSAQGFTILSRLTHWREDRARQLDRPPRWVIKDADLFAIAEQLPTDRRQLGSIVDLPAKQLHHIQDALLECVQQGLKCAPEELIEPPENRPPTGKERRLAKKIARKLDAICEEQDIAVEVVATRREIKDLVKERNYDTSSLLHGWRKDLVGHTLMDILEPG